MDTNEFCLIVDIRDFIDTNLKIITGKISRRFSSDIDVYEVPFQCGYLKPQIGSFFNELRSKLRNLNTKYRNNKILKSAISFYKEIDHLRRGDKFNGVYSGYFSINSHEKFIKMYLDISNYVSKSSSEQYLSTFIGTLTPSSLLYNITPTLFFDKIAPKLHDIDKYEMSTIYISGYHCYDHRLKHIKVLNNNYKWVDK